MLDFNKFKPLLGSWADKLQPFFESEEAYKIYEFLKKESQRGKTITPEAKNVYKAFELCSLDELKTVWVGLSPYSTVYNSQFGRTYVADGLAFSCGITEKEQPSLKLLWDAIEDDLYEGLNLNMKRETDLSFWANQGVLLLNSSLTAEKDKPESHLELWKPFMTYLFEEVFNTISGIPFVFFGKQAALWESKTQPFIHYTKVVEHPSFAARQNREFKHENLFSWTNKLLKENNGTQIVWDLPF